MRLMRGVLMTAVESCRAEETPCQRLKIKAPSGAKKPLRSFEYGRRLERIHSSRRTQNPTSRCWIKCPMSDDWIPEKTWGKVSSMLG